MQQRALLSTSRVISTARLARQMEWRPSTAAALCVWIGDSPSQATSVAVGFHPSQRKAPQQLLSSSVLPEAPGRRNNNNGAATKNSTVIQSQLQATLAQFPHLPLIVGWPVQREGGSCGAACGRVLHVLDRLQSSSNRNTRRTLSLYTPPPHRDTVVAHHTPDALGRDPSYSRTSTKQCHVASQEQQHAFQGVVENASDLWRTVCSDVWQGVQEDDNDAWRAETAALLSSPTTTLVQKA